MNGKRKIRLQKFLSQAGLCSRREAERKVRLGQVVLNGQVVKEMGVLVDPESDRIVVDQVEVRGKESHVYYIFHKPKNVMVTRSDPEGRPTVYDYLKNIKERVNYVGRLDFDSEGLVFLTNDGELHHRMTHPHQEIPKVYRVKVGPHPPHPSPDKSGSTLSRKGRGEFCRELSEGVDIGGYITAPCRVKVIDEDWIEMTITEGKNRQIRRMCEVVGLELTRLVRVAIGPLMLEGLKPGQFRPLAASEVKKLTEMFRETGRGPTRGL